jgi:formylglycine-generating enzyme required for sulfatase activity
MITFLPAIVMSTLIATLPPVVTASPPSPDSNPPIRSSQIDACQITAGTRVTVQLPDGDATTFVFIPPNEFVMGDADAANADPIVKILQATVGQGSSPPSTSLPLRKTTIRSWLYFAETKTTTAQFCAFLNAVEKNDNYYVANSWSTIERVEGRFRPRGDCGQAPISTVTFEGASAYCAWLSATTGMRCRLPTEAEWELAARGPTARRYAWGNSIEEAGRVSSPHGEPTSVYTYPKGRTPEGLYGMFGTVGEWCQDWYAPNILPDQIVDPAGPSEGDSKVLRGRGAEATRRSQGPVGIDLNAGIYGFRPVIDVTPTDKPSRLGRSTSKR